MRAKVKTLHVPYRGTSPSVTALLSGEVDLSYISYPVLKPLLEAGKFRPPRDNRSQENRIYA